MTELEKQVNDARLKAVEEAVIKFGNIADIVLVSLEDRVGKLEEHDKVFQDSVNESCTLKDKQITEGDNKTFAKCLAVCGAMFVIFVSAVAYFNNADGAIHEKINLHHTEATTVTTENKTNIDNIDKLLKEIRDIVRDNSKHTHTK